MAMTRDSSSAFDLTSDATASINKKESKSTQTHKWPQKLLKYPNDQAKKHQQNTAAQDRVI